MSREGVAVFLMRVMEDEGFRNELKASPDKLYMQDAAEMGSAVTNIPWTQLPTLLKHLLNP